jgi:hypothetical protein
MRHFVCAVFACVAGCAPAGTGSDPGQWGPQFPGAGSSESAQGLTNASMTCFYPAGGASQPAATLEYKLEAIPEGNTIHLRLTFNPDFVDNTYGATSVGWGTKGHKFADLVGSDHSELKLTNAAGAVLDYKADYISKSTAFASGYQNLGALGGDGKMMLGSASEIVKTMTSLDRNLNERGLSQYEVDSPATDAQYTPNPAAAAWDYRVVYESWVLVDAFGPSGFGSALLTFVHASPSKVMGHDTETVSPAPCPPAWKVPCDTMVDSSDQCPDSSPPSGFSPGSAAPPVQ